MLVTAAAGGQEEGVLLGVEEPVSDCEIEISVKVRVGPRQRRGRTEAERVAYGERAAAVVGEEAVGGAVVVADHQIEVAVFVGVSPDHGDGIVTGTEDVSAAEAAAAIVGPQGVLRSIPVADRQIEIAVPIGVAPRYRFGIL